MTEQDILKSVEVNSAKITIKTEANGSELFANSTIEATSIIVPVFAKQGMNNMKADYQFTKYGQILNHSDTPNCELYQHETMWYLKARLNIYANTELTIDMTQAPWDKEKTVTDPKVAEEYLVTRTFQLFIPITDKESKSNKLSYTYNEKTSSGYPLFTTQEGMLKYLAKFELGSKYSEVITSMFASTGTLRTTGFYFKLNDAAIPDKEYGIIWYKQSFAVDIPSVVKEPLITNPVLNQLLTIAEPGDLLVTFPNMKLMNQSNQLSSAINKAVQRSSFTSIKMVAENAKSVIGFGANISTSQLQEVGLKQFLLTIGGCVLLKPTNATPQQRQLAVRFMRTKLKQHPDYSHMSILKSIFTRAFGNHENPNIISKQVLLDRTTPLFCSTLVATAYAFAKIKITLHYGLFECFPRDFLFCNELEKAITYSADPNTVLEVSEDLTARSPYITNAEWKLLFESNNLQSSEEEITSKTPNEKRGPISESTKSKIGKYIYHGTHRDLDIKNLGIHICKNRANPDITAPVVYMNTTLGAASLHVVPFEIGHGSKLSNYQEHFVNLNEAVNSTTSVKTIEIVHNDPKLDECEGEQTGYIYWVEAEDFLDDLYYATPNDKNDWNLVSYRQLPIAKKTEIKVKWHKKYDAAFAKKVTSGYKSVEDLAYSIESYDPPYTEEDMRNNGYSEDVITQLKNDPVHAWRMQTGIELIHIEPTKSELIRIWKNWQQMTSDQKKTSDVKCKELFGVDNKTLYNYLLPQYKVEQPERGVIQLPNTSSTTEAVATSLSAKKKAIIDYVTERFDIIDKTKANSKRFAKMLNDMSEPMLVEYMKQLKAGKVKLVFYSPNLTTNTEIDDLIALAHKLDMPLCKRVWLPDPTTGKEFLTTTPCIVLQLPVRRFQQFAEKKIGVADNDMKIDILTGQVTQDDRASAFSNPEIQMLYSRGLTTALSELIQVRGGNIGAYSEFRSMLEETGSCDMNAIDPNNESRTVKVAGVLFKAMHLDVSL